ncbi:MAG: hypothetical protein WBP81_37280 [Solirubrobacteraceae bacterium]
MRKPVNTHEFADAVDRTGLFWLLTNEQPPTRDPGGAAQRAGGMTRR